ncbi:hypothetical protein [Paraburkholderia bannensis]|uniref:hypothetical protein n=1 Tax=Paraburkholderia bannensis TaxID=765414 RepID=UPI002AC346C8|nr:hypothetical protein [Paraburkholderia bannensis]
MALPEWGNSYNALYVPLKGGWQCALVPARDIDDVDRGWGLSYEQGQKARKARADQMEQDRRDFVQLFRVSIARRASRTSRDFGAYADFIDKHVRGRWHTPIDGEDVTRILREAVRDGLIVPVIDRDWRGSVGVSKRYAPQAWHDAYRSRGGGAAVSAPRAKTFHQSVMESMGLDADGATAYIVKYNAMVERIEAIQAVNAAKRAAAAAASNGDDLPGVVEVASGAALGSGDGEDDGEDADDNGEPDDDLFGAGSASDSTPLGDAQPFEYSGDSANSNVTDLAARGVSEEDEAECFAQYEEDMEMCGAGSATYGSPAYYTECSQRAFSRYQQCRGY